MSEEKSMSLSNAELGKSLIATAQEERRKRFTSQIVGIAEAILEGIAVTDRKLEFYTNHKETLTRQLAAIEAGEFTVSTRGEFQFNDKEIAIPMGGIARFAGEMEELITNFKKSGRNF